MENRISVAAFADSILSFTVALVVTTRAGILFRTRLPSARSVPSVA